LAINCETRVLWCDACGSYCPNHRLMPRHFRFICWRRTAKRTSSVWNKTVRTPKSRKARCSVHAALETLANRGSGVGDAGRAYASPRFRRNVEHQPRQLGLDPWTAKTGGRRQSRSPGICRALSFGSQGVRWASPAGDRYPLASHWFRPIRRELGRPRAVVISGANMTPTTSLNLRRGWVPGTRAVTRTSLQTSTGRPHAGLPQGGEPQRAKPQRGRSQRGRSCPG
jgi:hypothetical protein